MSFIMVAPAPFVGVLEIWGGAQTSINSVASVGGTLQYSGICLDGNALLNPPFGNVILPPPTITWTSSNTGIATVNSSTGLVTGVSSGVCEITATAAVGLQNISGSAMFGCALITPGTATISYGASQGFAVSGNTAQWQSGIPAVAQLTTGDTNGFGTTATAVPVGTTSYPHSSANVPIYAYIGGYGFNGIQGVIAVANLTVTNIP